MRWFLLLVVVGLGVLAYFSGLRLGYLTLTPWWGYNVQGVNKYTYNRVDPEGTLRLVGDCDAREGSATMRLFSPGGQEVASARCASGKYNLALPTPRVPGLYRLEVNFDRYTGTLNLTEDRAGPSYQNR